MKKVIAKSIKGKEYIYSTKDCYSVSVKKAKIVCAALNSISWNLKEGEIWFVHELSDFDYKYTNAVFQHLIAGKKGIRTKEYYSVYPGCNL